MGKNNIVVGKHCLEQSKIILSLCSKYTLITTDMVTKESRCIYPSSVQIVNFSPEEMCQYSSFFYENECLGKIGFTEGSLLFVALRRKCLVAAIDPVTQKVCNELGIDILKMNTENHQMDDSGCRSKDLRNSILGRFRRIACL